MKKLSIAKYVMMAIGMVGTAHAGTNDWTGFYAGVNAGYVFNDAKLTSQQLGFTNPSETCNTSSEFSNFAPGIQLGYLRQFTNSLVTGLESNTSFNTNQTHAFTCYSPFNPDVYDRLTFKNQLQTSIKARVGRAVNWNKYNLLPYLTAGATFADLGLTYKNEGGDYYSNTTTQLGWLIGAGVEWGFMQHWSVRAEYFYADYGNAINLDLPSVYELVDANGKGLVNLKSNNVSLAVNYWI